MLSRCRRDLIEIPLDGVVAARCELSKEAAQEDAAKDIAKELGELREIRACLDALQLSGVGGQRVRRERGHSGQGPCIF